MAIPVVTVNSMNRSKISAVTGFNAVIINAVADQSGNWQVERGGTGKGIGTVVASGTCTASQNFDITIDPVDCSSDTSTNGLGIESQFWLYVTNGSQETNSQAGSFN